MIRTPLLGLLLAGCTAATLDPPSLLPRPIETRSAAEPTREAQPVAADPALDQQIADKMAAFRRTTATFDTAADAAGARIGSAAKLAPGSDPWLAAQMGLGTLSQARAASDAALSELEALAIARASAGLQAYPALDSAIAAAAAQVDREASVVAGLQARLTP